MLDNEEPWLPQLQSLPALPRISSQVPELTILNTDKASLGKVTNSVPARNVLKTSNSFSPQVPDLSIIDHSGSGRTSAAQNRVLTQSYKDMLINTQGEIIKQNQVQPSNGSDERPREVPIRQGLLTRDYRPNPLCKYVPSKIVKTPVTSGNLSSILLDTSQATSPQRAFHETSSLEDSDDLQLKNVAGILSEIQKLITPSKERESTKAHSSNETLQKLAKMYLTADEYSSFAIDEEFNL